MEQQLLQEEIKRINAETMRAKERRIEEEKLADMRVKEYLLKKQVTAHCSLWTSKLHHVTHTFDSDVVFNVSNSLNLQEQQAEYEAEQRRIKKEKELEIARLRAQQEKEKDYKAEQVRI